MEWDYGGEEEFSSQGRGVFIVNEGNFQYGNSSLSFYDPDTRKVENEVFARANGMKLGDVAQSMSIAFDKGWIVVNNSHVVFAIDLATFREVGRIENLTSPRYILFISPTKAYVSQLWDNRIFIVNPSTYAITGYITVPDMAQSTGSTEQMVRIGRYVYCSCWSYQNRIVKIDTATDSVVGRLEVGVQPRSLRVDCDSMLWTLTDGGFDGSVYGYEAPKLMRIDPVSLSVVESYEFKKGDSPYDLQLNGRGDTIFWVNKDVWRMPVGAGRLPSMPFIENRGTRFFGMSIDPVTSEVYVADAIDFQQQGVVSRYDSKGEFVDQFYVGVNPAKFCWKK